MVEGLYVGFHISRGDLVSIGMFLGFGIGVGVLAAFGVLSLFNSAVKWIELQWKAKRRKSET